MSLSAQQIITVDMGQTTLEEGTFYVEAMGLETSYLLASVPVSPFGMECTLAVGDKQVQLGYIAKWQLISPDSSTIMSSYFVIDGESITIFPGSQEVLLDSSHVLYDYQAIANDFTGSPTEEKQMVAELMKMVGNSVYGNYADFVLARAYSAQSDLFSPEAIATILAADSRWFERELQRQAGAKIVFEKYQQQIYAYDRVILKFWATWCQPCLADNKTLQEFISQNKISIPIVAVQADSRNYKDSLFYNIVDQHEALQKYYKVQRLPTYVYIEQGTVKARYESLSELLSYLENK